MYAFVMQMYDITMGIIIRQVQNDLPVLILQKSVDVHTLDEFAEIYEATLFSS